MKTPAGIIFVAVLLALDFTRAAALPKGDNKARGSAVQAENDLGMASTESRLLASVKPRAIKCSRNSFVCMYPGSAGPNCCGGQCVDMGSDVYKCGRCGNVCKLPEACCKGKCVDLNFDKRHCGSCFSKCKGGDLCVYGMCNYA